MRSPVTRKRHLLVRLIVEHLKPHWREVMLAAFCLVSVAIATAGNAWLMRPALDEVLLAQNQALLLLIPIAIIGVGFVKACAAYFETILVSKIGNNVVSDLQIRIFKHLMRADLAWLHEARSGRLVSTFIYDSKLVRDALTSAISALIGDGLTIVFLIAVMFQQNWQLAIAGVGFIPLTAILVRRSGIKTRKRSSVNQIETGKLTAYLSDTFGSMRMVKAYSMEGFEIGRTKTAVRQRARELLKVAKSRAAVGPLSDAFSGMAVGLTVLYGGWLVREQSISPGQFLTFVASLLLAYRPMRSLSNLYASLQEGLAAAERLFSIIDSVPSISDRPGAQPLLQKGGTVRFDSVRFSYEPGHQILHGIDLSVSAGQKIALVGASGAGKSTIINLILRFYDVDFGRVLVDDQDVRDITVESLRNGISFVSQDTRLFDMTIRANIAYGKPGASNEDIYEAAKAAAAHDFISGLPQGYDTPVGEAGIRLSGGQRQRITIARAILRNAPILLLDEATSSLDANAEKKVQKALDKLLTGRTAIIVAHRLSTVLSADEIVVISQGRVVERGRHSELLAQGGHYAKLFETQITA